MNKKIARITGSTVAAAALVMLPLAGTASAATSTSVINGSIGSTITVSSSGPVNINVAPTSGAVTSSASDTVSVSTNDADGYVLSLETNSANRNLTNGSDTITPSAGTLAAPVTLATNTWGYRVNGVGGFTGTATTETNVASSAYNWAGVKANGSADTIKTTSAPASNDQTQVWYAMSANTSKPSGTYTNTVLYTAVAR
jgi:hypothetical protein